MKYDDEFDDELKTLLREWREPDVPAALDARVLASFRQQAAPRSRWAWLTKPMLVPWPVAMAAMLLLCAASWWMARRTVNPVVIAPPLTAATRFVEVPVVQEKVITRVVHISATKASSKSQKPSGVEPVRMPKRLPADLAAFHPVSEIKLEIVPGGAAQ